MAGRCKGRFYLTFEQNPPPRELPSFKELEVGEPVRISHGQAVLRSLRRATPSPSARSALPYRLTPDITYYYADLSGPTGEFGTLDYSDSPPRFFIGREVTLDDIGLPQTLKPSQREARQVAGQHLNCPQCGGALELRAPDKSERVVCPNCGALLDVNQGQLRYLETLKPGKVQPRLPLGSVGKFKDDPFMVIGFLRRSVRVEGVRYFWEEYLLYHVRHGFRWLVCSDSHWSYVEPLPPGKVHISGRSAYYNDVLFQIFQKATAVVENVQGEFYWKVTVGEEVQATDFVQPPRMLSREVSELEGEGEGEINWSLGTYLPVADVEKAFSLKTALLRPVFGSVAPNQPFAHKQIYWYWGVLVVASLVLFLLFLVTPDPEGLRANARRRAGQRSRKAAGDLYRAVPAAPAHQNVRVTVRAEVNNSWLDVEGDLIQEDSDLVQPFSAPVSYYHGVEDGESWEEGSKETTIDLSALPAGQYRLRLEFVADHAAAAPQQPAAPLPVHILVEEGAVRLVAVACYRVAAVGDPGIGRRVPYLLPVPPLGGKFL